MYNVIVWKHRRVLVCSKEDGLEGNVDKSKNMFMSHEQNAGHNHDIKICLKVVAKLRYL
jgi:hypothetical protein